MPIASLWVLLLSMLAAAATSQFNDTAVPQIVDHVCGSACGTFSQRVIFNASYARTPHPPLILIVGGENDVATWWSIVGAEATSLAAAEGAVLAAIEHRMFGVSLPVPGSLANLTTLDPAVAVTDLYAALPAILSALQLAPTTRVVLMGCSYSGTVASYSHAAPGVVGVVASSSPVQPEVSMESYHASILQAFADPAAGGSEVCGTLIAGAFSNASTMMAKGDWAALTDAWGSCEHVTDLEDARFMWYQTVDLAFGMDYVQENHDVMIPYVCANFTAAVAQGETPAAAFKSLLVGTTWALLGCTPGGGKGDYAAYAASIANTTMDPAGTRSDRQWWWLQCAHVGWLHTCTTAGGCPFTGDVPGFDPLPLDWYSRVCRDSLGVSLQQTEAGVASLLAEFGGRDMPSANIFAVNGGADPWALLALLPPPHSTRVFVPGGWHCADTSAPSPSDSPALTAARAAVHVQVHDWLQGGHASSLGYVQCSGRCESE